MKGFPSANCNHLSSEILMITKTIYYSTKNLVLVFPLALAHLHNAVLLFFDFFSTMTAINCVTSIIT